MKTVLAPQPPAADLAEIETDPTLRVVEEGLPAAAPRRSWLKRHSKGVSIAFALAVTTALVVGLYGKRHEMAGALDSASWGVLALACAAQVAWLLTRSEAWHTCVDAAGAECGRRPLFRAAAIGNIGSIFTPSFGLAVRIAELRRTAPDKSPCAGTLVAAEMPIVVVEIALAAICSFTLIAPLGIPWWVPVLALAGGAGVVAGLSRLAHRKRHGFWNGLAVLRGLRHRNTIIGLTVLAVGLQVLRNWLILRGVGVDISVFDAMALLIATAALGLLPIGPGLGMTTTVLILGSNGVAATAAAGALLTATGVVGAFVFAAWALADRRFGHRWELPGVDLRRPRRIPNYAGGR
ncbi:MAG: flippase-like domain-containing protein [Thermoleophilales bacterium]|nr:flippase-like domain-containing protein [Thermoleophilales bacterium]